MKAAEARRFAFELGLDVDKVPICLACLSIVSMRIDSGNQRTIEGAVRQMAPDLWAEGLELPAWTALEEARDTGVPGAEEAIRDVLERGCHSTVARAIVRLLAEQLAERSRGDVLEIGFQPWPPPGGIPEDGRIPPPSPLRFPIAPLEMEVRAWRMPNSDN